MQRHRLDDDAGRRQRRVQRRREVQAGGRRRRRPEGAGVRRLVALGVLQRRRDVRRQRRHAGVVEQLEHRRRAQALDHPAAVAERLDAAQRPLRPQGLALEHLLAPRPAAQERLPALARRRRAGQRAEEQHLDAPAGRAVEEAARREDARVVAHQHVALAQQRRQVGEDVVLERAGGAAHHEQARRVARLRRRLRDQLVGQLVVEVGQGEAGGRVAHAVLRPRRGGSCHASHLLAAQPQYGWR